MDTSNQGRSDSAPDERLELMDQVCKQVMALGATRWLYWSWKPDRLTVIVPNQEVMQRIKEEVGKDWPHQGEDGVCLLFPPIGNFRVTLFESTW